MASREFEYNDRYPYETEERPELWVPTTLNKCYPLQAIMKEADYCFFMSHGESGEINARLMHPFEPDAEFNIWLGASPNSRKVREILRQNKVTLAFINPRSTAYVTLVGTAGLDSTAELKRKYWPNP